VRARNVCGTIAAGETDGEFQRNCLYLRAQTLYTGLFAIQKEPSVTALAPSAFIIRALSPAEKCAASFFSFFLAHD
jgi:hypothetical protein